MTWEVGTSYRIWYQSEAGRATERTIDLLRVSRAQDGRVFLRAYCHLRNEERTFRADRVLKSECLTVRASAVPVTSAVIERPATVAASSAAAFVPPPGLSRSRPLWLGLQCLPQVSQRKWNAPSPAGPSLARPLGK